MISSPEPVSLPTAFPAKLSAPPRKRTGRMVRVDEDTARRASRLDQSEGTRRHAVLEQPLSFAEHHWRYPDAILVDEFGGDQRLQQLAAAPDMQRRPVRCLEMADLLNDVAVNTLRFLPVKTVEAARDDVFRCLVERLGDRVVALIRPVGGEDLVGSAPQKHVELTGDSLANGLVHAIVHEGHGLASVGELAARILLGATGRLHDAVESDLRDCDDLSHGFFQFLGFVPKDERPTRLDDLQGCLPGLRRGAQRRYPPTLAAYPGKRSGACSASAEEWWRESKKVPSASRI